MPSWKYDPYTGEPIENKPEPPSGYWQRNISTASSKFPESPSMTPNEHVIPITIAIIAGCLAFSLVCVLCLSAFQLANTLLNDSRQSCPTYQCPGKHAVPQDGKIAVPGDSPSVIVPKDNVGSDGDVIKPDANAGAKGDWYDPHGDIEFR